MRERNMKKERKRGRVERRKMIVCDKKGEKV